PSDRPAGPGGEQEQRWVTPAREGPAAPGRPPLATPPGRPPQMTQRIALAGCLTLVWTLLLSGACAPAAAPAKSLRVTPIVSAVQKVKTATVNIHSEKRARQSETLFSVSKDRKVNGMGTGVIIDERGYIVTNHHVVNGVDSLRVTLYDGS